MRPLTIVYGTAIRVADGERASMVRVYVHEDGRTYWGDETHELEHVCSQLCATDVLAEAPELRPCADDRFSFLAVSEDGESAETADVMPADWGDDPYVLCASCGDELYRDDESYTAMFGTSIPTNPAN